MTLREGTLVPSLLGKKQIIIGLQETVGTIKLSELVTVSPVGAQSINHLNKQNYERTNYAGYYPGRTGNPRARVKCQSLV